MSEKKKLVPSLSPCPHLHENLLVEIMSRIPAKPLARFKSVSKQWKSLLQEPTFIALHHKRAHSRSDGGSLLISIPLTPQRPDHELQLFSAPHEGEPTAPTQARPLLPPNLEQLKGYEASLSTHGLILFSPWKSTHDPNRPVFVFNPTTQELVPLPFLNNLNDDEQLCTKSDGQDSTIRLFVSYFLGYDHSTGVYKVLSIATVFMLSGVRDGLLDVERIGCNSYNVFTLGGKKDWRKLESTAYQLLPADALAPQYCCANGTIYLKTSPHSSPSNNSISAFNVREERFFLFPPPPTPATSKHNLIELWGCLGLARRDENRHLVWILEDRKWIFLELEMPNHYKKWRDFAIAGESTIAGGIQSSNKFLIAHQLQGLDYLPCVFYCDKSGKDQWSRIQIDGLPHQELRECGFLTSIHIETLFSPNACLQ